MVNGFTAELENAGTLEIDFGPNPDTRGVEDISGYDPLEDAVLDEEATVPEPLQPQPVQQQPPAQEQQRPIKGSENARIRILEREKKALQRREQEAQERLAEVVRLVLEKNEQPEQEEQPEDELDPVLRLERKVDRVTRSLAKTQEEEAQQAEQNALLQEQARANLAIQHFARQVGPSYQEAVAHLAAVSMDEYLGEHDDATPEEAEMALLEEMEAAKLKWIAAGKNPGKELLLRAVRRGYRLQAQAQPEAQQPAQAPVKQDVAADLRRENKRTGARSISSLPGASAQNAVSPKNLASMSETDFQDKVLRLIKERGGSVRQAPSMHDMLAGKGRTR